MSSKAPGTLVAFLGALRDLVAWLRVEQVQGLIVGGVAVSVLGRPRATHDVDALVWLDDIRWEQFLEAGGRFGFLPRVRDSLAFARKNRMLLLRHEASGVPVDLMLGALPFEKEAIDRAVRRVVGGVELPLPVPEDLIIMKAIAPRARDVADIEALLDAHPQLDLRRVRRRVREFSQALGQPELLAQLEAVVGRRRRGRK